jgi:stage V sporulation protein D (sporulation-specific penicillin-binding protein)
MDDPEYIVLVALDTPSRQTGIYISGGVMAAHTVGAVMSDILPYLGVERRADSNGGQAVIMEDLTDLTVKQAQTALKAQGLQAVVKGDGEAVTGQIPQPGQSVPSGSEVILYLGKTPDATNVSVPDFLGMNRQQASDTAAAAGLYILIKGNTSVDRNVVVTAQSVAAESLVPTGTMIELEFTDTKASD